MELKPCPFCGGTPEMLEVAPEHTDLPHTVWAAKCGSCGVIGPDAVTEIGGYRKWNRRTIGEEGKDG